MTSFSRKSPGTGCGKPIIQVLCTFELLQGFKSLGVAITSQEMTSGHHVTGSDPEMTSSQRKSPGSGCGRPISQVLGTFELLKGCNSQEVAVTWQEMSHVTPRYWM